MQIDRDEFLRYLGWNGQENDDTFLQKLDEAAKNALRRQRPKALCADLILQKNLNLRERVLCYRDRTSATIFPDADRCI